MTKELQDFKKKRGLRSELASLPTLNYVCDVYSHVKDKNGVTRTSFNLVESGCSFVGGRVISLVYNPDVLESSALEYVKHLKEKYPLIRKSPKNIYKKTKSRMVDWSLKKTQVVLQTVPGKVALWGVGAAANVSDKMLSGVYYITNRQAKPQNNNRQKERIGSYISPEKKTQNNVKKSSLTLVDYIVLPAEVTTRLLKTVHLWFHILVADAETSRKEKNGLSPEKVEEIKNRRKVSPRKRVRKSSWKCWSKSAIHFLKLDRILSYFSSRSFIKNIDPSLKDMSPNKSDDTEHKRKYDDIASDDSSEQDEPSYMDHLRKLDLSHYMSDEDPDYEPGMESTDSEEYKDDETESEGEFSAMDATPDPLPPRHKSTPLSVPSNTPSKAAKQADKSDKKVETPKKSILKPSSTSSKENENSKLKQKSAEKVKPEETKDYVQLTFKASNLDSKDIIGKSDPYLTIMKQGPDGKWQMLYKTEVILNSSDPTWKPFSVPLLSLWNGDKSKHIKITIYDKDDAVSDDFVGEAIVTLEEILKASKQEITWNIINGKKQSKKKNYINSGQVHLVSCKHDLELEEMEEKDKKKTSLFPLSIGLSVSATVVLALLATQT